MNNEDSKYIKYKYKIEELKRRRVRSKEWVLTNKEKQYIESLGYEVIPIIYEVTTKHLKNLYSIKNHKLREIHYANKEGKRRIGMKLTKEDMQQLKEHNIRFRAVKFKIIIIS